ncbi:uncharacterized protein LOC111706430 [Eurytemora carolleeae]|uniref:uncharacterized protein LOC111706430 n=1 Tax=Eurytemora carolleeae TaxID=1294199 RepID=UPI000C78A2A9|nr:uncharacterized protein LOC111706430 [Eurytemora carolleeae]|eukprot:XP_023335077.1 uncharacterized protein LOC111706430 [Eurytemora affinis]
MIVSREKRDAASCQLVTAEYGQCAAASAQAVSSKMTDANTKPDFIARSACNWLTQLDDCSARLTLDCFTKSQIMTMRDKQIEQMLRQFGNIPGWDDSKCPVVKEYQMRSGAETTFISFSLFFAVLILLNQL